MRCIHTLHNLRDDLILWPDEKGGIAQRIEDEHGFSTLAEEVSPFEP